MRTALSQSLTFLGAFLVATIFASDMPTNSGPNSPTTLAERSAGNITYRLLAHRMPRDEADPNSSVNTLFRLELQEVRADESRPIVRLSKTINLGNSEPLPPSCIGLSHKKICLVLAGRFALWVCIANRSGTTDLDQLWEEVFRTTHIPVFDGVNHPTARLIRRQMHTTSVPWLDIPGLTGAESVAASKAGTMRAISVEPEAANWLIKFQIGEKLFFGRYGEDESGAVTWDVRREN
jgi:hypothetical protein